MYLRLICLWHTHSNSPTDNYNKYFSVFFSNEWLVSDDIFMKLSQTWQKWKATRNENTKKNWIKFNRILIGERRHRHTINLFEYSSVLLPHFLLCSSIVNGTEQKSIHICAVTLCAIVVRASVAMQWQTHILDIRYQQNWWKSCELNTIYLVLHAFKWRAPHIDYFWWCRRSMQPMCPKL